MLYSWYEDTTTKKLDQAVPSWSLHSSGEIENKQTNKQKKQFKFFSRNVQVLKFPLVRLLGTQLVSVRMWVQSPAMFSGLRIWYCHELWCSLQMQFGSGVPVAVR